VQLEIPPCLIGVPPQTNGTYVPEMSNPRSYVFRTGPEFVSTRPLWPGQVHEFRIECIVSESTRPFLQQQVRATAYVDGEQKSEDSRPVAELTVFFLPPVAARREVQREMKRDLERAAADLLASGPKPSK
jgi:hypothetical protein